ncbi:ATP-binding protein [Halovenus marina]|uniref:ATP-binding protein n=1 Tax=Halovenus marina TaxID=3396621 RepID=UPI003F54CA29
MIDETDSTDFDWQYQTGVSMDDVGGMEQLKGKLKKDVIFPLKEHRGKAEKLGITAPNILFYGPPGTGKTYIAKALATDLGLPFVKISGSEIQSKWLNESAQKVEQLFTEAKMQASQEGGALIFLDELDSVLSKRDNQGSKHQEDNKVVNEFLNHLAETEEHNVVFVGATNRFDELDEAAMRNGRIDRKIEVGLPDRDARADILEAQLKQRSYKIATENLDVIAENAVDYSAADLEGVVKDAARNAAFERESDVITLTDIKAIDAALTEGTDATLSATRIESDSRDQQRSTTTGQTGRSQTIESRYRVISFADEARRMCLYDLKFDDTVWVNTVGYDAEIHSTLETIEGGNVVEAEVTDSGTENEYWDLLSISIADDTALYFVSTDGYAAGPTDEIWDRRDDGTDYVSAGRRVQIADEGEKGDLLYEIQLQGTQVTTDDGDVLDVYSNLQHGELLTEPFFDGNGCDYLLDGANAVIIVNPEGRQYVGMYLFPSKNEKFHEIFGALYDHVENE